MKSTLPNIQTTKLSQDGLVFHEIIADGLIHTASVFGIEPNERFVERIATLAWFNGAVANEKQTKSVYKAAKLLVESTEAGVMSWPRLGCAVSAATNPKQNASADIRKFYREHRGTRALKIEDAQYTDAIRQLVGEAVLGGILSRQHFPDLHKVLVAQSKSCSPEASFLTTRLNVWAQLGWQTTCHPVVELAGHFYVDRPLEHELVCSRINTLLPHVLGKKNPWKLNHWLKPAWIEGILTVDLKPTIIKEVFKEMGEAEQTENRKIFRACVMTTLTADGKLNIEAAYARYLDAWRPYCLSTAEYRETSPRILAVRAYDFAFWMGIIAELPEADGGLKGAL
jgi:hypothetical protein